MNSVLLAPDAPPTGLFGLTRHIAIAGVAGVVTGLVVAGLGGRVFMRIAGALGPDFAQGSRTEAGFTVGEVTVAGTLELVIFVGLFGGLIGAVHFLVFRPWLAWTGPWRGAAFGIVLFAIGSATSDLLNPDNFDFAVLGNSTLLVLLVFTLFVVFGAVIEVLFRALELRIPPADQASVPWKVVFLLVTLQGLPIAVFLVPLTLFSSESCSCDPPLLASAFVAITAIGTLFWLASSALATWTRVARVLGFVGLAGAVVSGLIRAISDSLEIIG